MACVLLAASRTRSASGAVEVETSVVSDGIFGWSASVGLLFDDFMCDVVNPLLRPEERFSECGGTFAPDRNRLRGRAVRAGYEDGRNGTESGKHEEWIRVGGGELDRRRTSFVEC